MTAIVLVCLHLTIGQCMFESATVLLSRLLITFGSNYFFTNSDIIYNIVFHIVPPSIENKHEFPSPVHRSRRPTSLSLSYPHRHLCWNHLPPPFQECIRPQVGCCVINEVNIVLASSLSSSLWALFPLSLSLKSPPPPFQECIQPQPQVILSSYIT